ncbi:cytochrome P450, partial [Xylaria longipes]
MAVRRQVESNCKLADPLFSFPQTFLLLAQVSIKLAMSVALRTIYLSAIVCLGMSGILSHRLYFIRGEHHLKASQYLATWILAMVLASTFLHINNFSILPSVSIINCAFLGPLFSSIVVYRIFQHPLRVFKGPTLASVSKLWHFVYMFKTSNHLFLNELVERYGQIVRTGPQELTIVDPDIWTAIGSRNGSCIKAPWYDMLWPYVSLNSIRGKDGYRARRKLWDDALRLSTAYLPENDSCINRLASLLVDQIQTCIGQPVDVKILCFNFSFDVMGELAFGRTFSLLRDPKTAAQSDSHDAPTLISQGMSMLRFFTPVPWVGHLCFAFAPYLPIITPKWNRALKWAAEMCDERLERGINHEHHADAFSRFILAANIEDDRKSLDRLALYGDAFAIIVAGSHSTAATLTMLCFELAQHPEAQQQARTEVLAARYRQETNSDSDELTQERYPFLDACINETLRLYPVVPTGGVRQTVTEGINVGGSWIPPNTVIVAPRWTLGRRRAPYYLRINSQSVNAST